MSWPRTDDGWLFAMFCSVSLAIASTKPSPSTLIVLRSAITFADGREDELLVFGVERSILDQRSSRVVREQSSR